MNRGVRLRPAQRERLKQAYAYTLLAVVFWTTGPVGAKATLMAERGPARLTPLQVAFWPIALGWVALLGVSLARRRLGRLADISARGWIVIGAMGLTGWAGYSVSLNIAYTLLPLPSAMVIGYLNPVFVVLFQSAAFGSLVRPVSRWELASKARRRPPVLRLAVGLMLCLLGVAVIATGGRLSALRGGWSPGALAAAVGAICWGLYSNLGRFVAVRPGRDPKGLGDVQNIGAMALGSIILAAGLAATHNLYTPAGFETALYFGGLGPARVSAWAPIVVMAVANYGAAYTLWLYALEKAEGMGEAHKLPPLTYLVLVLAIGGGWLVLRESFGRGFWQGASLIALGNLVTLWPTRRGPMRA